jgi:phosphorylcholine metabolism protein LicD
MIIIILICLLLFGLCLWKLVQKPELARVQMALREYFKEFDYICNTHDIQYWAEGGTLLGAVREKGIIPHDDDIDISLYESDFEKLKNVMDLDLYPEYEMIQTHLPLYKFVRKGNPRIFIDIFIFENENEVVQFKEKRHREIWPNFYHKLEDLFPLQRVPFDHLYIWIPKNPYPYLESGYGDWKTPIDYGRHQT